MGAGASVPYADEAAALADGKTQDEIDSYKAGLKPTLHYFDVSGRGELTKLIAAVGGVDLDFVEYPFVANGASAADKLKAGTIETAHTTAATAMGMEGAGLPIMTHGDLKFHQSFAVQTYVASIGPNFPTLTPKQAALDNMFQGSLEDIMGLAAGVILSGYDPTLVPKFMTKILTHLTKYIPEDGFVNGQSAPSIADCCILVLTQALIPFGATLGEGAAEVYGAFPAAVALGERVAAFPAVAAWLENEYCNLKKPPKAAREAAAAAAAAPEKKGYVFGFFDLKDPKAFKEEYSPMAEPTLEPYGGKFKVKYPIAPPMAEKMGKTAAAFHGTTGMMAFMVEFPSFEKAHGWLTGPEYGAVLEKRDTVSTFNMAAVEGAPIAEGAGLVMGFFDLKDPVAFKTEYSPMAEPTLEPYGGKFAVKFPIAPPMSEKMGTPPTTAHGTTGMMAFCVAFENVDKATGWLTGPEYGGVLEKRDTVSTFNMAAVPAM